MTATLEYNKRLKKLDKGVMIYFDKRHPLFDYATSLKVDGIYPQVSDSVITILLTDKTPDDAYADLAIIDSEAAEPIHIMATMDTANILKAFGADELTDELIKKGAMRLKHVVLLSYTELLDYAVPDEEKIY